MTGCTKISPGCQRGYAEAMAHRLQAMKAPGYARGFDLNLDAARLDPPLGRKKPTVFFTGSMADRFHDGVPDAFIERVLVVSIARPGTPSNPDPARRTAAPPLREPPGAGQRLARGHGGGSPLRAAAHRLPLPGSGPRPLLQTVGHLGFRRGAPRPKGQRPAAGRRWDERPESAGRGSAGCGANAYPSCGIDSLNSGCGGAPSEAAPRKMAGDRTEIA